MKTRSTVNKNYKKDISSGRFKKRCGCLNHMENSSEIFDLQKGKKVRKFVVEQLLKKDLLTTKTKHVCKECIDKNIFSFHNDDSVDFESTANQNSNSETFNSIAESENMLPEEITSCHFDLVDAISKDIATLYKEKPCNSIAKLLSYNAKEWLAKRPKELKDLLSEICNLNLDNNRSAVMLAKCIEQIYCCRNQQLVLPLSFRQNLLGYSLSNSKLLVNINGATSPAGSYSFLSKWLSEQAKNELQFPEGIVRVVFDNEQVIGKRYTVKADKNMVPMSVITSHAYISIDKTCDLQNSTELKPTHWMFKTLTESQNDELLNYPANRYQNYFRETRNNLIKSRLKAVLEQQHCKPGNPYYDFIDTAVADKYEAETQKECVDCGAANDPSFRLCTSCKGRLIRPSATINVPLGYSSKNFDPYDHLSLNENCNNISVHVGEPDMLNPNSFENIAKILTNLGERAKISKYSDVGKREWLFLENDGGILFIILKLIFNVLKCPECNEIMYGKINFEDHTCFVLKNVKHSHEFDWIVPQLGLLHLEMNSGKSFMSLNWNVFMELICKELGFTSENALKYIKKGSDHHKLWQLMETTYLAMTDEVLLPYVRHCLQLKQDPTVAGYWAYNTESCNPNYIYIQQMVFTYLHAMMLLRKGIRTAQPLAILAAKSKLALLFFGRNHPRYHDMLAHDFRLEILMPDEIKSIVRSSLSLSRTKHYGHYQSGDAAVEEINKEAKKWVIGVPTTIQWQRSFRNLDKLDEV